MFLCLSLVFMEAAAELTTSSGLESCNVIYDDLNPSFKKFFCLFAKMTDLSIEFLYRHLKRHFFTFGFKTLKYTNFVYAML